MKLLTHLLFTFLLLATSALGTDDGNNAKMHTVTPTIPANSRVTVHSLQNASEHNGKVGTAREWLTDQKRWSVALDSGVSIAIREANLSGAPTTGGFWSSDSGVSIAIRQTADPTTGAPAAGAPTTGALDIETRTRTIATAKASLQTLGEEHGDEAVEVIIREFLTPDHIEEIAKSSDLIKGRMVLRIEDVIMKYVDPADPVMGPSLAFLVQFYKAIPKIKGGSGPLGLRPAHDEQLESFLTASGRTRAEVDFWFPAAEEVYFSVVDTLGAQLLKPALQTTAWENALLEHRIEKHLVDAGHWNIWEREMDAAIRRLRQRSATWMNGSGIRAKNAIIETVCSSCRVNCRGTDFYASDDVFRNLANKCYRIVSGRIEEEQSRDKKESLLRAKAHSRAKGKSQQQPEATADEIGERDRLAQAAAAELLAALDAGGSQGIATTGSGKRSKKKKKKKKKGGKGSPMGSSASSITSSSDDEFQECIPAPAPATSGSEDYEDCYTSRSVSPTSTTCSESRGKMPPCPVNITIEPHAGGACTPATKPKFSPIRSMGSTGRQETRGKAPKTAARPPISPIRLSEHEAQHHDSAVVDRRRGQGKAGRRPSRTSAVPDVLVVDFMNVARSYSLQMDAWDLWQASEARLQKGFGLDLQQARRVYKYSHRSHPECSRQGARDLRQCSITQAVFAILGNNRTSRDPKRDEIHALPIQVKYDVSVSGRSVCQWIQDSGYNALGVNMTPGHKCVYRKPRMDHHIVEKLENALPPGTRATYVIPSDYTDSSFWGRPSHAWEALANPFGQPNLNAVHFTEPAKARAFLKLLHDSGRLLPVSVPNFHDDPYILGLAAVEALDGGAQVTVGVVSRDRFLDHNGRPISPQAPLDDDLGVVYSAAKLGGAWARVHRISQDDLLPPISKL